MGKVYRKMWSSWSLYILVSFFSSKRIEAVVRFLKFLQNQQENTGARASFLIKLQASSQFYSVLACNILGFFLENPQGIFKFWVSFYYKCLSRHGGLKWLCFLSKQLTYFLNQVKSRLWYSFRTPLSRCFHFLDCFFSA